MRFRLFKPRRSNLILMKRIFIIIIGMHAHGYVSEEILVVDECILVVQVEFKEFPSQSRTTKISPT